MSSNLSREMHPTGYPPTTNRYQQHLNNMLALPVAVSVVPPVAAAALANNKPKRLCRFPGCTKTIKSQGHCQRHGARSKRCRVEGCEKQAQGTHDGMCKRHWKAHNLPVDDSPPEPEILEPVGESAYDSLLPRSIAYRPVPTTSTDGPDAQAAGATPRLMPLVAALKEGAETKEAGWHRNAERAARGLPPVENISNHMEAWEKQLALIEILLLSGGTPHANFRHLAHAWGRDRGFHHVLINTVCERRGEIDRKRRSDARGYTITASKKVKRDHDNMDTPVAPGAYLQAAGVVLSGQNTDEDEEPSPQKRAAQV